MTATTAPKQTAAERRYAALNTLAEATRYATTRQTLAGMSDPENPYRVVKTETVVIWNVTHDGRDALAADIRALDSLGRTDRWKNSIERLAVEVETSTPETFKWAFDQHMVWACYAAE